MRTLIVSTILVAGLAFSGSVFAQASAVTATCKDGTTFSGTTRAGACRGHKGVQSWGDATSATAAPVTSPAASTSTPPISKAAPAQTSRDTPANGQVWVNTKSKVYHCSGDRDYGHTKQGTYMTEAAAKAEGDRPSRGKVCS